MLAEYQYESAWEALLGALRAARARLPGLSAGERLLAACSGGADSVVLLHGLVALRGPEHLAVAHVDHGLRPGARSDRDFVAALAEGLGLPLLERSLALGPPGRGRTGETRARELRYRAFAEMAGDWQAAALATGHHAGDQLETVLFRLLRGTGVAGLEGMPAARRLWLPAGPWVIRPLLEVQGAVLRAAAAEQGFAFVEDPTNQDRNITRNRIRHELLPLLGRSFGPGAAAALRLLSTDAARLQAALRAEGAGLLAGAATARFGPLLETRLPLPRTALAAEALVEAARQGLARLHPGRWTGAPPAFLERVRALLASPREGARALARGLGQVTLQRGEIVLLPHPLPGPLAENELGVPGETELLPGLRLVARLEPAPSAEALRAAAPFGAWLDEAAVSPPLRVRPRRPEDRFHPLGAPRALSLKRFLVARKVPWWLKDLLPLVVDGSGRILWVAGLEVCHPARIQPRSEAALALEIRGADSAGRAASRP